MWRIGSVAVGCREPVLEASLVPNEGRSVLSTMCAEYGVSTYPVLHNKGPLRLVSHPRYSQQGKRLDLICVPYGARLNWFVLRPII